MTDDEVIGKVGTVAIKIRGTAGPGEVTLSVRGGTETLIAYSDEPIDRHAEVVVIGSRGNRCVDVVRWPQ